MKNIIECGVAPLGATPATPANTAGMGNPSAESGDAMCFSKIKPKKSLKDRITKKLKSVKK